MDDETRELPDKIINFTTLKITRDMQKICKCTDPTYVIDCRNRLVTCSQCGAYTDPYDALLCLANKPARYERELNAMLEQRREIVNYKPHMVVFRNLEQHYRASKRGRMLPVCPQFGDTFRFEDIHGWQNERYFPPKKDAGK